METKNALFWYFWPKMFHLGIFGREFEKYYCHIGNQHPQVCLFSKFQKITKMPKFRTKSSWFEYFWAGIWKTYCHIWNQHPQICLIAKFGGKTKMPKFGIKNALFGYFLAKTLKVLASYLNFAPSNYSNCKIFRKK